jgi:hypothetical protein
MPFFPKKVEEECYTRCGFHPEGTDRAVLLWNAVLNLYYSHIKLRVKQIRNVANKRKKTGCSHPFSYSGSREGFFHTREATTRIILY